MLRLAILCLAILLARPVWAGEPLRVGLLAYGTVQWEIETLRAQHRDAAHGIQVQPIELAGKDGASVALLAGSVDAIVGDWLFVSRQRAMGRDLVFIPWSAMTGSVLVPAASPLKSLADLAGKQLGVAGGPQDKSWLLLRALGLRRHGLDLEKVAVPVYGAPPLLAQQMEAGRLDALLTFWPQAVPLEAKGYRRLVEVGGIAAELGIAHAPPLVGWIMHRNWAESHRAEVESFRAAERETRTAMCAPGFDWRGLDRLTRAADDTIRAGLAAGFCAAVPTDAGDGADAEKIFALLGQLGGEELTGPSPRLQPGMFW